jgi:hypothetical protein
MTGERRNDAEAERDDKHHSETQWVLGSRHFERFKDIQTWFEELMFHARGRRERLSVHGTRRRLHFRGSRER